MSNLTKEANDMEKLNKAKRNQNVATKSLVIFCVISSSIIYFDLGNVELFRGISTLISLLVPSISKTAMVTKFPESSALILSIAWLLVPTSVYWLFIVSMWKELKVDDVENSQPAFGRGMSTITKLFLMVLGALLLKLVYSNAPSPIGAFKYTRMVYEGLVEHEYFIVIYGMFLWAITAVLLWGILVFLWITYKFLKGGRK